MGGHCPVICPPQVVWPTVYEREWARLTSKRLSNMLNKYCTVSIWVLLLWKVNFRKLLLFFDRLARVWELAWTNKCAHQSSLINMIVRIENYLSHHLGYRSWLLCRLRPCPKEGYADPSPIEVAIIIYIKNEQCAETNDKSYFRFLVFEI